MQSLAHSAARTLRSSLRPCACRIPAPTPSFSPLRSLSSTARPSLQLAPSPLQRALQAAPRPAFAASTPASAPQPQAQQVRGFKMSVIPRRMRKKASPNARNGGAGKTARKHGAKAAKRRRMRIKKIN
ncbi:hypothetical protein Rhopal_002014-T1 [Rhodotorula paludigena]|uniref:Uncharacterized protein n=1 Tax=Rhodotorula paludigena TaxID=86838 RepID=A0AAV5GHU1_9BASI|nr:hypothetical protein Rhopal_002014-T1 [Rhodotorula paludigena]